MSIIVVDMEEELPTYSGRLDRLPSYTDIIERYREQSRNRNRNRNNISVEIILLWMLIVFILFVIVIPFIVVGIKL